MFLGCHLGNWGFSSLYRFSIGMRPGDWLGHSMTLISFLWSHFFVALAVYFELLPCGKTYPRHIQYVTVHGSLMVPSMWWSRPLPIVEKSPNHNISTSVLGCGDGVLWVILSSSQFPRSPSVLLQPECDSMSEETHLEIKSNLWWYSTGQSIFTVNNFSGKL